MDNEFRKYIVVILVSVIAFFLMAFYNTTNSQIDDLQGAKESDRVLMMKLETKLENIEHQAEDMKIDLDKIDKKLDKIISNQ